jgi:hypothetical protein
MRNLPPLALEGAGPFLLRVKCGTHCGFGIRAALAFAGSQILVGLFSWVWQFEAWHPCAATVAGAIGAVTLASAPFFPNRYLLALIACGAIFTAWVTWFTAVDMTKKTEELTKKDLELARYRDEITRRDHRIGMLKEYLGEFIARLPESEKAEVLTRGGAVTSYFPAQN